MSEKGLKLGEIETDPFTGEMRIIPAYECPFCSEYLLRSEFHSELDIVNDMNLKEKIQFIERLPEGVFPLQKQHIIKSESEGEVQVIICNECIRKTKEKVDTKEFTFNKFVEIREKIDSLKLADREIHNFAIKYLLTEKPHWSAEKVVGELINASKDRIERLQKIYRESQQCDSIKTLLTWIYIDSVKLTLKED